MSITQSETPIIYLTIANSVNGVGVVSNSRYLRVKLEAGVATEEKKIGFTGTLSYAFSDGTLTITSTVAGDFPSDVFIIPNQLDCNYEYVSNTEIKITPNTGYGTLVTIIKKEL